MPGARRLASSFSWRGVIILFARHIRGDAVVIDLHGDGTSVDHAAAAVQSARES